MEIYKDLKTQLNKKGIDIIDVDYYDLIQVWKSWYSGNVEDFHYYNVLMANGTTCQCERKTMNMPKKLAEDMEKLEWSDNVKIELGSKEKTKRIWDILDSKQNNFSIMFPKMLELKSALGTTAMTEYKDELGRTRIEYITDAMMIIPYKFDNYNITGFIAMNQWQEQEGKKAIYYTKLTYHEAVVKENETGELVPKYIKYNELYKSKDKNSLGKEIDFEEKFPNVENPVEYETDTPHFQILRPNIVNNIDIQTPMGLSIFANCIDRFKAIDIKYDSFTNEYTSGKKRILVDKTALKGAPQVGEDGEVRMVSYFDKNDTTYVALNGMEGQPVKEIDFNIRYNEHIDGINAELNWLSSEVGFGENYYKFDGVSTKTATEVKSEHSDAYNTKNSNSIIIRDVLIDLIKSICFLEGIEVTDDEIDIQFDYSKFKADTAEQTRLMQEVSNGITSKVEYRMKVYNETEEVARKKIQEIEESTPSINKLLNDDNDDTEEEGKDEKQKEGKEKSKDKDKDNKKEEEIIET